MSERTITVDGKVNLVSSMDDWYCIEHAVHDGRHWLEPIAGGAALRYSGRISDADVEGTADDMLCLAKAIRDRGGHSEKRCAVDATGDRVLLWSPRNSMANASITWEAADDLASQIESKLRR